MRTNGTKYDTIEQLPPGALPVSRFARKNKISSPAYVHVKYDRFKFGYLNTQGNFVHGEDPGYTIICYEGTNYVTRP
jgi:hypothetical protein